MEWSGRAPAPAATNLARAARYVPEPQQLDIAKNSFHVVGLDDRGAVVLRQNGCVANSKHSIPAAA
jgi:hypothetical protein